MTLPVPPSFVAVAAGALLAVAVPAWLTPAFTRPELYFGLTVPAAFRDTPEGHAILRRYRRWIAVETILALVALPVLAAALGGTPRGLLAAFLLAFAGQQAGWFGVYLGARRRVAPHTVAVTSVRQADLAPRDGRLPGGWALQLAPFAALAAVALYLRTRWASLPPRFPVHWGLAGRPDRWATRSPGAVYGPLLLGAAVIAGLALLAWTLVRRSRLIEPGGAAGAAERSFRRAVLGVVLAAQYLVALIIAWVGLLPLAAGGVGGGGGPWGGPVVLALSAAFGIAVVIVLARYGQGGTRLARGAAEPARLSSEARPVGDRSPDSAWKGGMI